MISHLDAPAAKENGHGQTGGRADDHPDSRHLGARVEGVDLADTVDEQPTFRRISEALVQRLPVWDGIASAV